MSEKDIAWFILFGIIICLELGSIALSLREISKSLKDRFR